MRRRIAWGIRIRIHNHPSLVRLGARTRTRVIILVRAARPIKSQHLLELVHPDLLRNDLEKKLQVLALVDQLGEMIVLEGIARGLF